jgi:hypothetical protein
MRHGWNPLTINPCHDQRRVKNATPVSLNSAGLCWFCVTQASPAAALRQRLIIPFFFI